MKKENTTKKMEAKSRLNISDWVAFLSSERQAMMSNVVTFSVFLVAVIALILVTSGYVAFAVASGIVAFGCAAWVYFVVLEPLRRRGKLADEILRGIISGQLKDADSIRQEWLLGLTVIRRGWFRQEKARLATLKETWRPRWETGLATLKETWYQQRATLAALRKTWHPRWERGISALKETWCQGKARLVAFRETWRRQWEGGISYSQASVAPVGTATSYARGNSGSRNKPKQVRAPSRRKKSAA